MKPKDKRTCNLCGQEERRGLLHTTIAKHLGICAECINRVIKQ